MPSFMPPVDTYGQFDVTRMYGLAYRLMRHYGSMDRGRNVYLLKGGVVTETDPDSRTIKWSDVDIVWWGSAAVPYTVSDEQAALLTAAGYTVTS